MTQAMTTNSSIEACIETKKKGDAEVSSISRIYETTKTQEIAAVPSSNYGTDFQLSFKSLCMWPRRDGTLFGLLRGPKKASGRMSAKFVSDILPNLGEERKVSFRGVEQQTRYGLGLKITNGVVVDELPELTISEDDFAPAKDFKPVETEITPTPNCDVTDLNLPAFIAEIFQPEENSKPGMKRKIPEPPRSEHLKRICQGDWNRPILCGGATSDNTPNERHQPEIPQIFDDWQE